MNKSDTIFIAGHKGLVGSALVRELSKQGYHNLITMDKSELDLTNQADVHNFFNYCPIDYVFLAAAKVGGIFANQTYPAEFIYNNLQIQNNVIHASYMNGIKKLMLLGSVCIYGKYAANPIKEESLLTGELEPTNKAYAIAKIAGIEMCQAYNKQYKTNYISVMPTNLLGINDNYHPENSHVIPALIRKFHTAKINNLSEVIIWGSGNATREFLSSDDLANACIFLMNNYNSSNIINIGSDTSISIKNLAILIKDIIGYNGEILFDTSKPDGTPLRKLDNSKLFNMGWQPTISLSDAISISYQDFLSKI